MNQNIFERIPQVETFLLDWQQRICTALLSHEASATSSSQNSSPEFLEDRWNYPQGGGGITRVLNGSIFEKAAVNFSHIQGNTLPAAATAQRPELVGCQFQAMGVSTVIHPGNPFVPTTHANLRFFVASSETQAPQWWFGGGFDLTPYYAYAEDCRLWHQHAAHACSSLGDAYYEKFKTWADSYFFLKHRNEARGIGGLFFDDVYEPGFDRSFAFIQNVAEHFIAAYLAIVAARKAQPFSSPQREFQLVRRGRYVEFNLLYDRGTLFGLQSSGRTESILVSLPPLVKWQYAYPVVAGSAEAQLTEYFLKPRNWLEQ